MPAFPGVYISLGSLSKQDGDVYEIDGDLPLFLIINFEFYQKKINVAQPRSLRNLENASFQVVVLQRTVEKSTRLYFARAVSLFCSLTPFFGGVLYDASVVVFLNSLLRDIDLLLRRSVYLVGRICRIMAA